MVGRRCAVWCVMMVVPLWAGNKQSKQDVKELQKQQSFLVEDKKKLQQELAAQEKCMHELKIIISSFQEQQKKQQESIDTLHTKIELLSKCTMSSLDALNRSFRKNTTSEPYESGTKSAPLLSPRPEGCSSGTISPHSGGSEKSESDQDVVEMRDFTNQKK